MYAPIHLHNPHQHQPLCLSRCQLEVSVMRLSLAVHEPGGVGGLNKKIAGGGDSPYFGDCGVLRRQKENWGIQRGGNQ